MADIKSRVKQEQQKVAADQADCEDNKPLNSIGRRQQEQKQEPDRSKRYF